MIYVRVRNVWYTTEFNSMYEITWMAFDNIDMLYNDKTTHCYGKHILNEADPTIQMNIWIQEPLRKFNETKFNNLVTHYEETGQKIDYNKCKP